MFIKQFKFHEFPTGRLDGANVDAPETAVIRTLLRVTEE